MLSVFTVLYLLFLAFRFPLLVVGVANPLNYSQLVAEGRKPLRGEEAQDV